MKKAEQTWFRPLYQFKCGLVGGSSALPPTRRRRKEDFQQFLIVIGETSTLKVAFFSWGPNNDDHFKETSGKQPGIQKSPDWTWGKSDRDWLSALEAPISPCQDLNLWYSQAGVKGSPPGCFGCKGSARLSSDWDRVNAQARRTPSPVNSISLRKQTAPVDHKQDGQKRKKKISSHSLFTFASSISSLHVSSDRHIFWSATPLRFIINFELSHQ